jgi:ribosomal protein L34E
MAKAVKNVVQVEGVRLPSGDVVKVTFKRKANGQVRCKARGRAPILVRVVEGVAQARVPGMEWGFEARQPNKAFGNAAKMLWA